MAADILARGLAAKAFATVRAQAIAVEDCGATGRGNDQPAFQRAIDLAIANGVPKVTCRLPRAELWCPLRTQPFSASPDGIPLVVTAPLHLDFGGAALTLKGVGGGDRFAGQAVGGYNDGQDKPWLGGWLYVVGNPDFSRIVVENVAVDGGFAGDVYSNTPSNVTDKGFRIQDQFVGEVILRNLELKNFAGEICYLGLVGDTRTHVENCHFHGSPQSAWNPPGTGRVTAINLEAGRAYAPAEIVGGRGHSYIGGRFYDGTTIGVFGGPDPAFDPRYPYVYAIRRDDAPPPFVNFAGTRFEAIAGDVALSSFVRGRIVTVDAGVLLTHIGVGHLKDIDLDIEAWVDRIGGKSAVALSGPESQNEAVAGAVAGTIYAKSSNIDVRVRCRRTALAQANSRHIAGVLLYPGLYDHESVRFRVSGACTRSWQLSGAAPAGFAVPRIEAEASYIAVPNGGEVVSYGADAAHRVTGSAAMLFHAAAGTVNLTMDGAFAYAAGQRFTFHYGGTNPTQIFAFARNGAGLKLAADRTLRRAGEYLSLEYNRDIGRWVEAGYLGESATASPVLIDAASGVAALSSAPWELTNQTAAAAGATGPYGTGEATRCTNQGPFAQIKRVSPGLRTLRARVKAGTTGIVALTMITAAGYSQGVFYLDTGMSTFDPGVDGSLRAIGGGWWLAEITGICTGELALRNGGNAGEDILVYDLMLYDG